MYAVVTTDNYGGQTEVIVFPDEEKAKAYLRKRYEETIETEKAENPDGLYEEMCEINAEDTWCEIAYHSEWSGDGSYEYQMMEVIKVKEEK